MGLIFKDLKDDQTEALIENMHVGLTWQFRYLRIQWALYGILASITTGLTVAVADYAIMNNTDYSGIIDWLLSRDLRL